MKPISHEALIAGAKLAAQMSGCNCRVVVTVRELRPGVVSAECAHEARCKHPSQRKGRDA